MAARLLQVVVFPCRGCSFTAVTRVQIPSGTPNIINHLDRRPNFPRYTPRGTLGSSRIIATALRCAARLVG